MIYSDGVTEVGAESEAMFGEKRLGDVVREQRNNSLDELLQALLTAVTDRGGGVEDNLTLLLARVRG